MESIKADFPHDAHPYDTMCACGKTWGDHHGKWCRHYGFGRTFVAAQSAPMWAKDRMAQEAAAAHSETPALDPAKRPPFEAATYVLWARIHADGVLGPRYADLAATAAKYEAEDARKEAAAQAAQVPRSQSAPMLAQQMAHTRQRTAMDVLNEWRSEQVAATRRLYEIACSTGFVVTGTLTGSVSNKVLTTIEHRDFCEGEYDPAASDTQAPATTPERMQRWLYGSTPTTGVVHRHWTDAGNALAEDQKPNVHVTPASSLAAPRAWERRK